MEYRKLGNSDIRISAIAFGAWAAGGWMWGGTDRKEAVLAIEKSIELGVSTIDTAPVYGFGLSEEIVAEAVAGKRDQVQILTKYGLRWDTARGVFYFDSQDAKGNFVKINKYAGKPGIIEECENSLRRLKTDYIDLYQIHWPDPTTPIEETMEAVATLLKDGKIRAAGVSNYSVEQLKTAEKVVSIASNQVPYSMVNRGIESDLVPYCLERNIGILAYSPLQRGLLTGKITDDYSFASGDHRPGTTFFKPENRRRTNAFLNKIKPLADSTGANLSQLVINWTIQQPGITCALVGARNPAQAEENAKILQLSPQELQTIRGYLNELELVS
ncbi:aldo/keto reductase [Rhodocytophaga rosea]|uniref:Aldo/keto reductase n=1 Tax=Rhodocytophaga rosea TaxID=2704465 RepID=A0A6C0GIE2_9BACT|nr:aldo/keto reductase [Rhodocytophaga rosea]QHT67453.1 aldo/keto reductase [Rhodocytophaga rosea]